MGQGQPVSLFGLRPSLPQAGLTGQLLEREIAGVQKLRLKYKKQINNHLNSHYTPAKKTNILFKNSSFLFSLSLILELFFDIILIK